jgi:hypothetical protein
MSKYLTPILVLVVAVLAIILVKGSQVMLAAQIEEATPQVEVTPVNATIAPITCYDMTTWSTTNITLVAADNKTVLCNATVNDENGASDFNTTTPTGAIYDVSLCGIGTYDADDCYTNSSCSWGTVVNLTAQELECTFTFRYNAEIGMWTAMLNLTDSGGNTSSRTDADEIHVDELLALDVPTTLNFGIKIAGVNDSYVGAPMSCTDCNFTVSNYGNTQIDLQLNGTDLTGCTLGSIPVGYLHYNCTDWNASYATEAAALNETLVGAYCTGFNLVKETTPANTEPVAETDDTYWGIGVPPGVRGTCSGTIWFAAVAG